MSNPLNLIDFNEKTAREINDNINSNLSELDNRTSNIDNTSDADKPVSNATKQALDNKLNASELKNATETVAGIIRKATTEEAENATNDNTAMTPLKVAQQAIKRLSQNLIYRMGAGSIFSKQDSNLEGGEIRLEKADNSTLSGNVSIDLNAESLRFFEDGGSARGVFIDLKNCDSGASSKIFHSGILSSLQNVSGSTIMANASVAGSSLNPAQDGTWRNISGNDVLNDAHGLFERI